MAELLTTCTRDCPCACSIVATVEGGRVLRLRGNPNHSPTGGVLCEKAPTFVEQLYSPRRATTPLLRRRGEWEPVSWDTALDYVAAKVRTAIETYGSHSLFHYQRYGSLAILKQVNRRFFDLLGGATTNIGAICNGAAVAAQIADFGEECGNEFDDVLNSKLILLWGRDPASTQVTLQHTLGVARGRGIPMVAINPIRSPGTFRAAWHVWPRPGTDGHLALAVARTILDRGWGDLAFVEQFTQGFEAYRRVVESRTAAGHAAACDVPLADVERLAEWYATTKPASIWIGAGLQRYRSGGINFRLVEALGALTGNLGVPGGGVSYQNSPFRFFDPLAADALPASRRRGVPMPVLGQGLFDLQDVPIRMFFCIGGNPVCQSPNAAKVAAALDRIDCVVVIDRELTDTADHADVFLPTTHFLEEEDLVGAQAYHGVGPVRPVAARVGDVRTDLEIFQALADRLGIGDQMAGSPREWIRLLARPLIEAGVDLERALEAPQRVPGTTAVYAPDRRYKTASGKFQLAGEAPADVATHPDFPLHLLTMKDRRWTNSQVPDRHLGERPKAWLHPETARAAGLADRQEAIVRSKLGEIRVEVSVREAIRPDTVLVTEGRDVRSGKGVNVLTEDVMTDLGLGTTYYDARVRLLPG